MHVLLCICTVFKQIVFIMTFWRICIATILMDNHQHHQQSLKQFQGFQLLVV